MLYRFRNPHALVAAVLWAASLALSAAQDSADIERKVEFRKDGVLWAGVFLADPKSEAPPRNEKVVHLIEQLGKAFPEDAFTLIGETTQAVFSEYESWVVPSRDLFLKIDSKGVADSGDGVHLHLQLWQKKNVLLKTDAILRRRPLFIECPKWQNGRAVMVLELLEKEK